MTFGFYSAVNIATDAIDCIHTTAASHNRVFIVEVMGHKVGWLTLYAGIAGGADVILIPEIPYHIDKVMEAIDKRTKSGKGFTVLAVAEGAVCAEDLKLSKKEYKKKMEKNNYPSVAYELADQILKKSGKKFDYPVEWGIDLQTEHERYLTEEVFKKPIFVTDYPKEIKAFYMRLNDDGKTVAAADCLVPGIGEIIGGSQREERLSVLEARMDALGLKKEDYWWYLDLRRYGSCRHAGYGLGFERLVMYLTGVSNIRDVELHPRTTGNADF
jgi:aspartyl/asparaginyl-tRNA synthetase